MRTITPMLLLASLLALGAGCNDMTDCPSAVAQGTTCSASGLSCFTGASQCTCTGGLWQCAAPDMRIPDLAIRDLTPSD